MNVQTRIGRIQAVRWNGKKFEGEVPDWLMHLQAVNGGLEFNPPWTDGSDELERNMELTVKSRLRGLDEEIWIGLPGDYIVKEDVSDENDRIRIISTERFQELYEAS